MAGLEGELDDFGDEAVFEEEVESPEHCATMADKTPNPMIPATAQVRQPDFLFGPAALLAAMGAPQPGHVPALSLTSLLHSEHFVRAISSLASCADFEQWRSQS